jgi:hypothetical protein
MQACLAGQALLLPLQGLQGNTTPGGGSSPFSPPFIFLFPLSL